ncbi:hypothetical protein AMTRI_Chr01g109340 [Amborella trichopoda]
MEMKSWSQISLESQGYQQNTSRNEVPPIASSSVTISPESQGYQQNTSRNEVPPVASSSISFSCRNHKEAALQYIDHVSNLIECCLQKYMNREEVKKVLIDMKNINPSITNLVWKKLEEENPDFFKAYYVKLTLIAQITQFNQLLEGQNQLMNLEGAKSTYESSRTSEIPATTSKVHVQNIVQNGIHPMAGTHTQW